MQKLLTSLIIIFSLSACASGGVDSPEPFVEVTMLKYKFIPQVLVINKGQTVRWINREKRQYHSVWFEKYGEKESDYMFPDDILDKKFDKAGEFEYRCGPHPEMIGKIIVK